MSIYHWREGAINPSRSKATIFGISKWWSIIGHSTSELAAGSAIPQMRSISPEKLPELLQLLRLICLEWIQDDSIFCVTSCEFDEKRATKPRSTFRNNLSHGKLRVFVCHISPPLCLNWSSMYSKVSLTRYSSYFARTNAFHLRIG